MAVQKFPPAGPNFHRFRRFEDDHAHYSQPSLNTSVFSHVFIGNTGFDLKRYAVAAEKLMNDHGDGENFDGEHETKFPDFFKPAIV